jgi:hypothetical protein
MYQAYDAAAGEARAANEARFATGMQGFQDIAEQGMEDIEMFGGTRERQIARDYGTPLGGKQGTVGAAGQQSLVDRGLYGMGGMDTRYGHTSANMLRGVQRQKDEALMDLEERKAMARVGTRRDLYGDLLGFMERKEDMYPDRREVPQAYGQVGRARGYMQPRGRGSYQRSMYGSRPMRPAFRGGYGGGGYRGLQKPTPTHTFVGPTTSMNMAMQQPDPTRGFAGARARDALPPFDPQGPGTTQIEEAVGPNAIARRRMRERMQSIYGA